MKRTVIAISLLVGIAMAYLKAYEVQPVKAEWSGKASGNPRTGGVGQIITCNFDSLVEVALFTGFPGAGGNYDLQVRDLKTNELVAYQYGVTPAGDHRWLRFTSVIPIAGKKFVREANLTQAEVGFIIL